MSDIYGKPPEPLNKYAPYGRIKEVCGHDLEKAYDDGWRLIEVIGYQETGLESEPCNVCSGNVSYGQGVAYRGLVYTKPRYLVGKRYDDELAEVQGELIAAQMNFKTTRDKLTEETALRKETSDDRDKYQEMWNTQHAEYMEATTRARKLDADFVKLRNHFGERVMKEALDG